MENMRTDNYGQILIPETPNNNKADVASCSVGPFPPIPILPPNLEYFRIFTLTETNMVRNKYKKNISQVSSIYLKFNLCRTAIQVSHLNNMGFLALNDQFFILAKVWFIKFETL